MKRFVFVLFFGIAVVLPALPALAATKLFIAGGKPVSAGDRFSVTVQVAAPTEPINAISGTLMFPSSLLEVTGISTAGSTVNFWIQNPKQQGSTVPFEGIILSPGYQGSGASLFEIFFEAKRSGRASITFREGAVLAHDGKGTNLLASLAGTTVPIAAPGAPLEPVGELEPGAIVQAPEKLPALPVITEFSKQVAAGEELFIKGKGEPGALTKLSFTDTAERSLGERFINLLQTKKHKLGEVFVQNRGDGTFEYTAPRSLIAGAYSATPFLVDADGTQKPGLGAKILVSDSKLVRFLVVLINVLALLVPVVALIVVIYFIPWYSWRRMRVLRRQLGFEEKKILFSEHQVQREDERLGQASQKPIQGTPGNFGV